MNRALGRGFESFFEKTDDGISSGGRDETKVVMLKTSMVEPRRDQPRKNFDREQLQALAASISEHGIIQPIIVTEGKNGYYSIIAGERRWRASRIANLTEIPAIVKTYSEIQAAEVALIENLQREDLNPIEEAEGYKLLMDRFGLTQDKVSERIGKSRSNVANMLRLLTLGDKIKEYLSGGKLTTGHARALLAVSNHALRDKLADKIIDEGLTVRQTEIMVKEPEKAAEKPKTAKKAAESHYAELEHLLSEKYGTKVRVKGNKKGKIEIEYYSVDELTRIIDAMGL